MTTFDAPCPECGHDNRGTADTEKAKSTIIHDRMLCIQCGERFDYTVREGVSGVTVKTGSDAR